MLPSDPSEDRSRPPDPPGGRTRAAAAYQACAVIIGLAPAALVLILGHGLPVRNLALPALISVLFALFAWLLGGVTVSGAIAGFGVAFTLFAAVGWQMFGVLLVVFLLTWAATRIGRRRKTRRGLLEPSTRRTASQVVANVGLAAYFVAVSVAVRPLSDLFVQSALLMATLAVLAEAAADTCASEIGKAFGGKTFLITSRREVPAGTDGGVSWWGTVAALVAAIATVAIANHWLPLGHLGIAVVTLAATLATFVDSVLGATLERRGWLNNDAVNLLSTATAALLSVIPLALLLYRLGLWR
jgi:uncharacterized protein (TIGR00297 family)